MVDDAESSCTDRPKLAVVVSCYNYEAFVQRAIESIVRQARADCEIVVVDDGSTDDSWKIITLSGVRAYRISNGGQRAACVYGLDRTSAPFVLFLDADDELKPGALDTIIGRLDPQVAKLQFALTRIDADGKTISGALPALETFRSSDRIAAQVLRTGVYTSPPTSGNVFRRDVCELLRDAAYDKAVDGVILFAAPFKGDIVSLSDELGNYRIHGRNDSGLGRLPDVASLQREVQRFSARMDHLRAVVLACGCEGELAPLHDVFYFKERSFCLEVASGRRPPVTGLPRLLRDLAGQTLSAKRKAAIAAFFILASVLPNARAKALLAYRFSVGHRSTFGFLKQIVAP